MKKKIFVAGIYQESNSFSPLMSEQKDFFTYLKGEELLLETPGVRELEAAGYEVIPGLCASAWPLMLLAEPSSTSFFMMKGRNSSRAISLGTPH